MGASGWDSSQLDTTGPDAPSDAARELAQRLRFLLDRAGMTPRQLAEEADVPYTPTMLYRFLSGRDMPPPQLIEVVARKCGEDVDNLHAAYDRARAAAMSSMGSKGRRKPTSHRKPKQRRAMPRLLAGVAFSAVGSVALTAAAITTFGHRPVADDAQRPPIAQQQAQSPVPSSEPTADPAVPRSSQRNSSGKQRGGEKKPTPSPSPQPSNPSSPNDDRAEVSAAPNLVANGTFDVTTDPWQNTSSIDIAAVNGQLRISVPERANGLVRSNDFALEAGERYRVQFDASATLSTSVIVVVQTRENGIANQLVQTTAVDGSRRTRAFEFVPDLQNPVAQASMVFQVGSEDDDYAISIDNVSLTQVG